MTITIMYRAIHILALGLLLHPLSRASSTEAVRLQLKWRHQFQFAGYYAAIEKGFYTEENLKVELIEPTFDGSTIDPVMTGLAEYGISSPDIVLHRARGEPVVALASIYQHSPHAFVAMESSGMETVHDLIGKRVMMENGAADLIALLLAEQIPLNTIKFTPHTFSEFPLTDAKVDALSAYITDEPFALEARGYTPIIFSPRSAGIDFYGDGLFTTEARIKEHPEEVAAFVRASLRGWAYALDHPEEIVDLILEKYSTRKSREALIFEAKRSIDLIKPDLVSIGYMYPGRWEHIAEVYQRVGLIQEPIDIHRMLYLGHRSLTDRLTKPALIVGSALLLLATVYIWRSLSHREQLQAEIDSENFRRKRTNDFRLFYEDAPLPFIIWDTELRVKYWNRSAEKLFGWTQDEVLDRSAINFLVPKDAHKAVHGARNRLSRGETNFQTNENLTKDGRTILCRWHSIPQKSEDGSVFEFHSIAFDVTRETEERNALVAENLSIRNESLEKDQLLAHTSHEIRNPLNAIMGYAQILQEDAQDAETQEMARVMVNGAESMLSILNDLLDCSKIDVGRMELNLTKVNLNDLIEQKAKLFKPIIARKKLTLKVTTPDAPCTLETDSNRLSQILSNLLSNATKFTESGSIEFKLAHIQGSKQNTVTAYRISVKDNGSGMNPETLQKVFEPFTQANSEIATEHGGTGLGLSLAQKLSKLLGGELHATSELGKGSEFILTLPIQSKV